MIAVQRDLMTGGDDPPHELGAPHDLLADHEERRPRARASEQVEHRRRALRMGPVVERQRHAAGAGQRARKVQRPGGVPVDRCEQMADHASMMASCSRNALIDSPVKPDLDKWLADPALRVAHQPSEPRLP